MEPKKTLLMMVGLPRSGKSTVARNLALSHGYAVVNRDAVRLALHGMRFLPLAEPIVAAITVIMVRALFMFHDTVVLDECNVSEKRRKEWLNNGWEVAYYLVDTPKDVCLGRAEMTADLEIMPVIERMANEWDYPYWHPVTGYPTQNDTDKVEES